MDDEREVLRVHVVDQRLEALNLVIGVGDVAEQAERERSRRQRRELRAAGEKQYEC